MTTESNELLLKRITQACDRKGIKITNLDIALGFSRGYTAKIAKAIKTPPIERIQAIAQYLDVTPEWLMYGEDTVHKSVEGEGYYFSDETAQAAQRLFESRGLRVLFDAAQDESEENLLKFAAMIRAYKDAENKD